MRSMMKVTAAAATACIVLLLAQPMELLEEISFVNCGSQGDSFKALLEQLLSGIPTDLSCHMQGSVHNRYSLCPGPSAKPCVTFHASGCGYVGPFSLPTAVEIPLPDGSSVSADISLDLLNQCVNVNTLAPRC